MQGSSRRAEQARLEADDDAPFSFSCASTDDGAGLASESRSLGSRTDHAAEL